MLTMVVSTTAMKEARHNRKSARRFRGAEPDTVAGSSSLFLALMVLDHTRKNGHNRS
jgi:hypothetical protein